MTMKALFHLLEPLILFLGSISLVLLLAAGIVYLIKLLWKPILIGSGSILLLNLVYTILTT